MYLARGQCAYGTLSELGLAQCDCKQSGRDGRNSTRQDAKPTFIVAARFLKTHFPSATPTNDRDNPAQRPRMCSSIDYKARGIFDISCYSLTCTLSLASILRFDASPRYLRGARACCLATYFARDSLNGSCRLSRSYTLELDHMH